MKPNQLLTALPAEQSNPIGTTDLQHLVDSLSVVVFTLDKGGLFTFVNQTFFDVLGYVPAELIGTPCLDLVIEGDREKTSAYFEQITEGRPVVHFENRFEHKEGHLISIAWATRWASNEGVFYCTIHDITEKRQLMELRQRYQAELLKHNQEMSDMLQRITDGFLVMDNEWRITYANLQALQIVKRDFEQIHLQILWDCFPSAVGTIFESQYRKAVTEQVPVNFEAYYPEPLNMWLEISAYPSATSLSVFFKDITRRKETEEERRTLSLIAKETENIVVLTTADNKIAWVNDAFITITGYSFEEVLGKTPGAFFVGPDADPNIVKFICEQRDKAMPLQVEILNYTKKGETYWLKLHGQPIFDKHGCLQKYFFMGTDITHRKKTEEELHRLSLIAKKTENIVLVCDAEGRISWGNDAFVRRTGYTLEEAVGKFPPQLFHGPETNPETVRYLVEKIQKGESCRVEILDYTKSRETFWSELFIQPIRDEEGKVQQYFALQTDITERRELQKKLEREQKERQKEITAATIKAQESERAHVGRELHDNVNQMLTTVKLYNELCRDGRGDPKELLDKSIAFLQDSINEIRSLSKRLSAPTLGAISLSASVKDLVESIDVTHRLSITIDSATIDSLVVGQELHIAVYRILQEHLTNVLKHAEAKSVAVVFDQVNGQLILRVTDDGKGFDISQKRSGIGITNMMTRAESLNGTLTVDSAPGMGCVLTAKFPIV